MASNEKSIDVISEVLGDWGAWQRRATLLIYLCKIPSAWFMACIIYTAPFASDGEYFCERPQHLSDIDKELWIETVHLSNDFCSINAKAIDYFNQSIIVSGNEIEVSIESCSRFEHDSIYDSLVTQFDLVCSRTILIAVTQFSHLFGVLAGGVIATILVNYFRPKNVVLLGMIAQIICGCLTGLTNSFVLHNIFRSLSALCCALMFTAGQLIFTDITGGNYRKSVVCLFESFWGVGVIILPFIAHYFPSWTSIYLAISLPTVLYILLWPFIPYSPRWLLRNGRIDEVKHILVEAAVCNGTLEAIPKDIDARLKLQASFLLKESAQEKWITLWNDRQSIVMMSALHTAWAIYFINYNGMLLNIRVFGRAFLLPTTISSGITEIFGVLIALFFVIKTSNRKWYFTGLFNIITGFLSCLGLIFPETLSELAYVILGMTLAMASKMATTCSQAILFTCTHELITTRKQKICILSCIVWARIWFLTAPFIGVFTTIHNLFPLAAYGMLGAIGGICTCIIDLLQRSSK